MVANHTSLTPTPHGLPQATIDFEALNTRYAIENEKRHREDGYAQFEELNTSSSERLRKLDNDPWVNHEALNAQTPNLQDDDEIRVLILGAGYGGLLNAIHLVKNGFKPSDIRLVDVAGGFGGTWWWNRYPGLMCDTEGYTYLPMLEESGFIPKHRYSYGPELLQYANVLADKWELTDKGVFRSQIQSYEWDDALHRWIVAIKQQRSSTESIDMTVRAQFVVVANGVLNFPKVPKNISAFEGPMTHTARFDYNITGGSPTDQSLTKLQDKRVGIIGTGATAIQLVPELAKWCKELYVFQRTPSSVGVRNQHQTKAEEWNKMTAEKGWQKRRLQRFCATISQEPGAVDEVQDGWSEATAYRALIGGHHELPLAPEDIPNHIDSLLQEDAPRAERIRRRVDEIVKDKKTAESLKPWYPCWCKRPTFHDDYLPAFNLPNVHLIDTNGKGIEKATTNGLTALGKEYPLDVLVLSTGYRSPGHDNAEPGSMSSATIKGRNGIVMADRWNTIGPSTLHGVLCHDFPNLFLTGPMQAGVSSNFAYVQLILAEHCAYIMSEGLKRAGSEHRDTVLIEGTEEGEEDWANLILERASYLAAISVCGPSYLNGERPPGDEMDSESQSKEARGATYPLGMNAYVRKIEEWRAEGSM
ncbi:hypothetical protein FSARC_14635, partial [Fusarium sarcochroum]